MPIAPERSRLVFRKLERSLAKLPSGKQGESVHDFRTSARRLQTLLEDVLPDQSRNQKKLFHDCALVLETIPTCMVKTTLIKGDGG